MSENIVEDICAYKNRDNVALVGNTVKGKNWIIQNMDTHLKDTIVVKAEHLEDIIKEMEKDELTVYVR